MKLTPAVILVALVGAIGPGCAGKASSDDDDWDRYHAEMRALYEKYEPVMASLDADPLGNEDELLSVLYAPDTPDGVRSAITEALIQRGSEESVEDVVDGLTAIVAAYTEHDSALEQPEPVRGLEPLEARRRYSWAWFALVRLSIRDDGPDLTDVQRNRVLDLACSTTTLSINLYAEVLRYLEAQPDSARRSELALALLLDKPPYVLNASARLGALLQPPEVGLLSVEASEAFGSEQDLYTKIAYTVALAASETSEGDAALERIAVESRHRLSDPSTSPHNAARDERRLEVALGYARARQDPGLLLDYAFRERRRHDGLPQLAYQRALDRGVSPELVRLRLFERRDEISAYYVERTNEAVRGTPPLTGEDLFIRYMVESQLGLYVDIAEQHGIVTWAEVFGQEREPRRTQE